MIRQLHEALEIRWRPRAATGLREVAQRCVVFLSISL